MKLQDIRAPWAFLLIVFLLLAGCSGSGSGDDSDPGQPEAPALEPSWTANELAAVQARMVRSDDHLLHLSPQGVTVLDAETGKQVWSRKVADGCTAGDPNPAGDVVMTAGDHCREVLVLDGATGKVKWRKRIPSVAKGYDSGNVVASIGDRAVSVVQFCGQVTRLSVEDGKRLGVLAPHDRLCGNEADSDGQTIALWHDAETSETPDDHGTDMIPPHDGEASFEVYDADSGKLLWRRDRSRRSSGLREGAVVSSKPLVLALEEDDHTTMHRYRGKGDSTGKPFGRQLGDDAFTTLSVVGDVLLGTYATQGIYGAGQEYRVFAYALSTGKELWSRMAPGRSSDVVGTWVAGADDDGVVLATMLRDDGEGSQTWISRWDLRTGKDLGTVGHVDNDLGIFQFHFSDGLFVVQDDTRLSTYRLPAPDPELTMPIDQVALAEDDLTSDPLAEPCTEVSDATLRTLGLRASTRLPTPADCTWSETAEPDYSNRGLRVQVHVAEPSEATSTATTTADDEDDATVSAADNAAIVATQWRKEFDPDLTHSLMQSGMSKPQRVGGLGDEAYVSSGARFAGSVGTAAGYYLQVRVGNAVVEAQVAGDYELGRADAAPPSLKRLEEGTFAAVREVFASLGVEFQEPLHPDPGVHRRATGVCRALESDAAALGLQGGSTTAKGADERVADCAWDREDSLTELNVHVYAASGRFLDNVSAPSVAKGIFRSSGLRSDEKLHGIGDQATINRDDATEAEDGYAVSERDIMVRSGNLVVNVDYQRGGEGLGDLAEQEALRLVRKVLTTVKQS